MSKPIPAAPSFVAWQKAAGILLTLETALAFRKRTVLPSESPDPGIEEIESCVTDARLVSDELFRIAFAEARQRPERPARAPRRMEQGADARG